jgi:hypothetical protein
MIILPRQARDKHREETRTRMLFGQAAGIWTRGSKNADKNSLDGGGSLDSVVRPPNTLALEVERRFLTLVAPLAAHQS